MPLKGVIGRSELFTGEYFTANLSKQVKKNPDIGTSVLRCYAEALMSPLPFIFVPSDGSDDHTKATSGIAVDTRRPARLDSLERGKRMKSRPFAPPDTKSHSPYPPETLRFCAKSHSELLHDPGQ
ncbi:hypothetical protein RY831_03265 [Noviherbaspirillum sp. CPCC 100848]|uniref:Uncharacterized protein n=1 Tax=Noviherbaspirillum album TaxID=3080276 RepID=A0ABU6J491_9BURK|nr:hypothetical protein [Noviherbaspirillum sp. CPCC 100848]MEC4718152.1 hypothetical protein [Noviherbaspirillum sp. CPCC 100848]